MEGDLHQIQMPEGFFATVSLLTRIAEVELWRSPLQPSQPCAVLKAPTPCLATHLDLGGQGEGRRLLQMGCRSLLMQEHSLEKSDDRMAKVPKLEQTISSDILDSAMEPPSYPDDIARKRLNLGSQLFPPSLLLPSQVPPSSAPPSSCEQNPAPPCTKSRPSTAQHPIPPTKRSRSRRKGISERIRLLAKLMPGDRKMTISVILEEARKYVKFLEAQVAALQCMPSESRFACPPPSSYAATALPTLRGLERLTRQQLLHILVRSPLVQDKLCERGLCVFATEQVVLMRQVAERERKLMSREVLHQTPLLECTGGSSSTVSD